MLNPSFKLNSFLRLSFKQLLVAHYQLFQLLLQLLILNSKIVVLLSLSCDLVMGLFNFLLGQLESSRKLHVVLCGSVQLCLSKLRTTVYLDDE